MNQENVDFLKNQLKSFGFADKLNEGLENSIKLDPPTFQLIHKGEFKAGKESKNVDFILNFKKSEKNDRYYFNNYNAVLKSDNPDNVKAQTFYVTGGITAKEAFNLLDGRTINKDITGLDKKEFNAWRQLDFNTKDKYGNYEFKQYHENFGYKLDEAVSKFPIKELSNEDDKTKLLKSLQKGDLREVSFISEGNEQKMFISANPHFKSINVYDGNMKSIYTGTAKEKSQDAEAKKEKKETKESVGQSSDSEEGPAKRKGKGVKV